MAMLVNIYGHFACMIVFLKSWSCAILMTFDQHINDMVGVPVANFKNFLRSSFLIN